MHQYINIISYDLSSLIFQVDAANNLQKDSMTTFKEHMQVTHQISIPQEKYLKYLSIKAALQKCTSYFSAMKNTRKIFPGRIYFVTLLH